MEFEEVYTTYFKSVYHYVWQLSGSEQLAEELTSETFFKAMRSIDRFRGDCDIRAWLCQIAKNTYFSYCKRHRSVPSLDAPDFPGLPAGEPAPDDLLSRQEDVQRIRKILHDIPDPHKEVFLWRVFGELSFQEIGELFGKTGNWACVTYHRTRKMIQRRLEEMGYET